MGEARRARTPPATDEFASRHLPQRLVAEWLGAGAFTIVDAGTLMLGSLNPQDMPPVARSEASGLLIIGLTYALGNVSGAHFNPITTLGFALRRAFPWEQVPWYVGAQCLGALCGALVLLLVVGSAHHHGTPQPTHGPWPCFGIETVCAALLILVTLSTATRHKVIGVVSPLATGGMVMMTGLLARPLCDPSTNPARTLGTAILDQEWWVLGWYVGAQLTGTVLAWLLAMCVHPHRHQEEERAAAGRPDHGHPPPPAP